MNRGPLTVWEEGPRGCGRGWRFLLPGTEQVLRNIEPI